ELRRRPDRATLRTGARPAARPRGTGSPRPPAGRADGRCHSFQPVPAGRLHELPPAPVIAALVVLAGVGDGDVGDGARQLQAVVLEGARRAPQAHFVIIRMLPRDRPAARLVGVVPVLHVVLLGEPRRPGIPDVVMA